LAGYLPSELIVGDWLRARCVVQGQSWEWWSTDTGELLPKPWWGDARVIRLPPEVPVLAYAAHPALRGVELRSAGEAQGLAEHLAVREWEGGASASPRGWFVFQAARFEDGRLHPIDLLWAGATPSPLPWDVDERRDLLARLLAECPREVKKQVGSTLPMEPVAVATGAEPISELSIGDLIIDTDDALRYRVAQSQRHKPFSKAEWELMLSVEARAGGARRQRGGRGSPEEVWDLLAGHEVSRLSRLHGSVSLG